MAPLRPRTVLTKDKFSAYFAPLKSQPYIDSTSTTTRSANAQHRLGPSQATPSSRAQLTRTPFSLRRASLRSIAWNPLGTLVATGTVDRILRVCECPPPLPSPSSPSLSSLIELCHWGQPWPGSASSSCSNTTTPQGIQRGRISGFLPTSRDMPLRLRESRLTPSKTPSSAA